MQYTLRDLLLVFVLFASAMGVFGAWGIVVAVILLGIIIAMAKERPFLFIVLSFGLVFLGLIPAVVENREDSHRAGCSNNLKQVALGVLCYAEWRQKDLPAYVTNANNQPIVSWRTLNLPSMEYSDLLQPHCFKEPWNDPINKDLKDISIPEYLCPSNLSEHPKALTNYVVITGPNTLWPDRIPCNLKNIPDGAAHTILVMEWPHSDILWAEPRDLTIEQVCKEIDSDPELKMFAAHEINRGFLFSPDKGANVAFADGSVRCLSTGFLRKYLKAMLTRNGGEKVDFNDVSGPRLNWSRIIGLAVLAFSAVCLLRRPKGDRLPQTTAAD